jgi:hypothetical protein
MSRGRSKRLAAVLPLSVVCLLVFLSGSASAHEEAEIGKVRLEIGFADEPAYAGFQNDVFLTLADGAGHPVMNAADTLKVEVVFGDQKAEFPLLPNFEADTGGAPGQYRASFIPTRPGKYTFHLFGSVMGEKIDRSFTSSPTTFDEVVEPSSVQFPVKDPSVAQVAGRIERELPRVSRIALAAADRAHEAADTARTIAYVAGALGMLGLVVGMWGLLAARRARVTPAPSVGPNERG